MSAGDPEADGSPAIFHYHRGIAPMMWVFFALASIELVVVHFLLALWRVDVALLVSALTVPTLLWLLTAIASFRRLPVVLADETLIMRTGRLRCIEVPLNQIAGVRGACSSGDLKRPGVADFALIAYPNVLIDLTAPVQTRRGPTQVIAHRMDDPAAIISALNRRLSAQT